MPHRAFAILFLLFAAPLLLMAVINPALQPADLAERYEVVLVARITSVDLNGNHLEAAVEKVYQGHFAPTVLSITAAPAAAQGLFALDVGKRLVAYVGKKLQGRANELLFYTGTWHSGTVLDAANPGAWSWNTVEEGNEMYGIFNGQPDRLGELAAEIAAGRGYFPCRPYCGFRPDQVLGKLAGPARGVALADIDGDGKLDAIATSTAGVKVWMQREGLRFEDATASLGLTGAAAGAVAVAVADVDGEGRPALLLDGVLWQRAGAGAGYVKNARLPAIAGLISATFEELDGDGWPDVLAATGSGVRVHLNPGKPGEPFIDATARLGFESPECGAGQGGLVASGDWDGDGRSDLFLAVGKGLLLSRDATGVFHPRSHKLDLELKPAANGERCGGAAMGPIWSRGAMSLLVPRHAGYSLVVERSDKFEDVVGYCNETSEPSDRQLWTLAEDLNADGEVDLYTASGSAGSTDVFLLNRGAGSFMRPLKYDEEVMPGPAHKAGSWGVAVGDVDGDGANDLLLGGSDGTVSLLLNAALDQRRNLDEAAAAALVKLAQAHTLAITVKDPRGKVGASLSVTDGQGQIVALRRIGANAVAGSWSGGPLQVTLLEVGTYTLTLRRSDGRVTTKPLTVDQDWPPVKALTFE